MFEAEQMHVLECARLAMAIVDTLAALG